LLETGNTGREIIRMDDVLERLGREFHRPNSRKAVPRFSDPEQPAFRGDVYDTDRRVLERDAEPCLAAGECASGLFGAPAFAAEKDLGNIGPLTACHEPIDNRVRQIGCCRTLTSTIGRTVRFSARHEIGI
jgi:hypothetical protein